MTQVWASDLPADEKFLALCLADFADDQGERIYPSQAYMAWKTGRTDRAVRKTLRRLIDRGLLQAIEGQGGGRNSAGAGQTVHYRMKVSALPARDAYIRNPEQSSDLFDEYPELHDTNPELCNTYPELHDAEPGTPVPTIRHLTTRRTTSRSTTGGVAISSSSLSRNGHGNGLERYS